MEHISKKSTKSKFSTLFMLGALFLSSCSVSSLYSGKLGVKFGLNVFDVATGRLKDRVDSLCWFVSALVVLEGARLGWTAGAGLASGFFGDSVPGVMMPEKNSEEKEEKTKLLPLVVYPPGLWAGGKEVLRAIFCLGGVVIGGYIGGYLSHGFLLKELIEDFNTLNS